MAKRKTLGEIAAAAFWKVNVEETSAAWERAAAAVEREVLRRLHESDRRRANTKKPKH